MPTCTKSSLAAVTTQLQQDAKKSLAKQVARCWPADLPAPQIQVLEGAPVTCITQYTAGRDFDLVVMGSHGAGFLEQLFLGTTATRLVKRLQLPTLVVRKAPETNYQKILVPIDFSSYSASTVQAARRLSPKAEIVLMHAFESLYEGQMIHAGVDESTVHTFRVAARQQAALKIRALAGASGLTELDYQPQLVHGRAHKEILTVASAQNADCIAIGKQGKGFLNELLLGSVTKHVLFEATIDVLVQPALEPET